MAVVADHSAVVCTDRALAHGVEVTEGLLVLRANTEAVLALSCPALPCPAMPCPALPCPLAGAGYAFQLSEFVRSDDATGVFRFFGHLIDKISLEASKNHISGIKFDLK